MPSSPSPRNGIPQPKNYHDLSKQDAEDLAAINGTIDRMRAFTPQDPYVLTIPQDEPRYHHQYAFQARQWLDNTPFDYREHESTQYQTFHYHEPGREMYMLHSSRPAEATATGSLGQVNGEAPVVRGRERAGTGANTPAAGDGGAGPKKTMSLNAYKKKQTGQATPAAQDLNPPAARKETAAVEEVKVKKAAVKGPVERLKVDEEMLAAVEEDADTTLATSTSPAKEKEGEQAKRELKRKREDGVSKKGGESERQLKKRETGGAEEEERVAKKVKRTPPPAKAQQERDSPTESQPTDQTNKPTKKPSSSTPKQDEYEDITGLPPRLSPLSEPSVLPSRLSPTLPANIAAVLKAREQFRSASRSSDIRARSLSKDGGSRLTPPPNNRNLEAGPGGTVKRKSPVPKNAFRANSSSPAVRSDAEERRGRQPATSVPSYVRSPLDRLSEVESQDEEIAVGRAAKAKKADKAAEKFGRDDSRAPSLVVKLKFRKASREPLRRILKSRPDPGRESTVVGENVRVEKPLVLKTADQRRRQRRDTNAKGVAQKIGPATTSTPISNGVTARKGKEKAAASSPDKRARPEESDDSTIGPPVKRKKDKPTETPHTPVQQPDRLLSPSANSANAPKPTSTSTPTGTGTAANNSLKKGRELLSAAVMKRELSTDSHVVTPSAGTGAGSQSSPSVVSRSMPEASQQQANGIPKSQPAIRTPAQQAWESAQKRLDALGRELKHAASAHLKPLEGDPHASSNANDQKLAAVKSLESLLAYMLAFACADEAAAASEPKSNPSPRPWRTLHGFFGFVKRNCEPFPLLLGVACWLGVVFNARILEIGTLHPVEASSGSRDAILETQAMLLRAAHEAEGKLDIDALQGSFPTTWERRHRGGGLGDENSVPGKFHGPYKLPLGVQSSPVRAVRAGYALLEEWVGRQQQREEGREELYRLKLKLDG